MAPKPGAASPPLISHNITHRRYQRSATTKSPHPSPLCPLCLPLRSTILRTLVFSVLLALTGCGSPTGPRITGRAFTETPARVEPSGDRWVAVFTAPTGGWRAEFDTTRRMFNGQEVFVTLIKPHPDLMVTQALTDLHVRTPVATTEAVRIYARTSDDINPDESPPDFFRWLFGWLLPAPAEPPYSEAATAGP